MEQSQTVNWPIEIEIPAWVDRAGIVRIEADIYPDTRGVVDWCENGKERRSSTRVIIRATIPKPQDPIIQGEVSDG